ncbi:4976_t:CDS:2 [Dentiscutata erythropus]|uniref:4976_t:CDS:1 n=1 Tax=Dentiscutata erythropus TaxID=1348616 RepID=A0A9N9HYZ6_9GLOM|nr:4976_t:CDS:2 [Dentiscutata erythropus]
MDNEQKKKSYTLQFKLDVVSYTENTSNRKASMFYKVDRRCVQKWRDQKSQFEALKATQDLSLRKARVLGGRGRKPKYPALEQELIKYIKEKQDEELSVTTHMISTRAKELAETLELVQRSKTQIAQKFPEDTPVIVQEFLKTALWFNMPRNSTLDFRGVREVRIRTTENDKLHFTVVLGFTASGHKLPPMIIFKLKKVPKRVYPRDIIVAATTSGSMNGDLMLSTYISKVIRARPDSFFKTKGVIFVDCHGSHIRDDVIKALNAKGLEVSEVWKEIGQDLLIKSFDVSGLTLNPNGSEDLKMSSRLQAIVKNRLEDAIIEESSEDEPIEDEEINCDRSDEEINVDKFIKENSNSRFDGETSNNEIDERNSDNEFNERISDSKFEEINNDREFTYDEFDNEFNINEE